MSDCYGELQAVHRTGHVDVWERHVVMFLQEPDRLVGVTAGQGVEPGLFLDFAREGAHQELVLDDQDNGIRIHDTLQADNRRFASAVWAATWWRWAVAERPATLGRKGPTMDKTRRYSIEVKDTETGAPVMFTSVDWDDEDKRVALAQIMRLTGAPLDCEFLDMVAPEPKQGEREG
jgi:hypothetical protein